ncbi:MAG: hypothetical protein M3153_03040 [Chloroflexota bacterium]|nr:hypothetical protein [Chloroflexota bacterium]
MNRTNRIALLAAAVVLLLAAGTVLANRAPTARDVPGQPASSHEADASPSAEDLAHAADRLEEKGIPFDQAVLDDLAARYGVGGAIRVLAWADSTGIDVGVITARRDGTETGPGMGWGRIARDLGVHPGLGSIMGAGHGREGAPGQQHRAPEE